MMKTKITSLLCFGAVLMGLMSFLQVQAQCPAPTVSANGPTTFNQGGSVTLTASASNQSDAGNALNFYSSYVTVPHNSVFTAMANSMTIEAWIYQTDNVNNAIVDKGNYNFLFMAGPNGQSGLGFYNTSGGWTYGSGVVPTNQWVHVAMTWNQSTGYISFYLNGSLMSTHYRGGSLNYDSGNLNIGRQDPASCQCNIMSGQIDELRLWNVARSGSQIASDYSTSINPATSGLVAYWKFNETSGSSTYDATSNGNTGTLGGNSRVSSSASVSNKPVSYSWSNGNSGSSTTISTSGSYTATATYSNGCTSSASAATSVNVITENALHFDGVNDYVNIGNHSSLNINQAITVEAWVKPNSTSSEGPVLFNGGGWGIPGYAMHFYRGNVRVELNSGSGGKAVDNPYSLTGWHHIAFTFDASTDKILFYVDGVLQPVQGTWSGTMGTYNGSGIIGAYLGGSQSYFDGAIDELRIWNYARCGAEINHTKNCYLNGNESGLVAYYKMDQGVANGANGSIGTLTDELGNSNGTLYNMAKSGSSSNFVSGSGTSGTCTAYSLAVNAGNDITIQEGQAVTLTGSGATSYSWNNGVVNGVPFYPTSTQTYTVTGSANGCSATDQVTVTVLPNNALNFDGINDYVQLGSALTYGSSSLTAEFWVRVPKIGQGNLVNNERVGILMGNYSSNPNQNFEIHAQGQVRIYWNNGQINAFGTKDLRDNKWHRLTFVRDKSANRFYAYIDGVLEINHGTAGSDINLTSTPRIGGDRRNSSGGPSFHGWMDEVRIYNYAMNAGQVANKACVLNGNEPGLIHHYTFNNGTANGNNAGVTAVVDQAGNNNGTLIQFGLNGSASNWTSSGTCNSDPIAVAGSDQSVPVSAVSCSANVTLNGSGSSDPEGQALTYEWKNGSSVIGTSASISVTPGLGTHTYVLTVFDVHGACSMDTMQVTVSDNTAPTMAASNVTVYLDGNGSASITTADVDNGSSDNCGLASLALSQTNFSCADVGSGSTLGTSSSNPGLDCATIKKTDSSATDGTYWIDPDGTGGAAPYQCYCDMTTDGGGWMLVAHQKNTGAFAPYNSNLSPTFNYGTYVADPKASTDFYRSYSNVSHDQLMFASGDNAKWLVLDPTCARAVTGTQSPNCQVIASGGTGITAGGYTNVLFRSSQPEDPWIGGEGSHSNNIFNGMLWGENGWGPGTHGSYKNAHQGLNLFVRNSQATAASGAGGVSVTLTGTDNSGNTASATAIVDVKDTTAPNLTTQNTTLYLDANGQATLASTDVVSSSSDNCGNPTLSLSQSAFTCADAGGDPVDQSQPSGWFLAGGFRGAGQSFKAGQTGPLTDIEIMARIHPSNVTCTLELRTGSNPVGGTLLASAPVALTTTVTTYKVNFPTPAVVTAGQNYVWVVKNGSPSGLVYFHNDLGNPYPDGDLIQEISGSWNPNSNVDAYFKTFVSTAKTVSVTATDAQGNTATSTADVSILDTLAPVVQPQNLTVYLGADGTATISAGDVSTTSDNCSVVSVTLSDTAFDCSDAGVHTVTITATDASGNVGTGQATVTVIDNVPPQASANDLTVYLDANGSASVTVNDVDSNSTDNCSIASRTLSVTSFGCSDVSTGNSSAGSPNGLYFPSAFKLHSMNNNGTGFSTPVTNGGQYMSGAAYDISTNKLYWIDASSKRLMKSDQNGANQVTLVSSGMGSPRDVAIDPDGQYVYFSDYGGQYIKRVNTDGTGLTTLASGSAVRPLGIYLDRVNNHIYWADLGSGSIKRMSTNGTGITTVVSGQGDCRDVAFDAATSTLYWNRGNQGRIYKKVGAGSVTTLVSGLVQPYGVFFNDGDGKIYFTETSGAQRVSVINANGTGKTVLKTGLNNPVYISVGQAASSSSSGVSTVLTVTDVAGNSSTATSIVTVLDTIAPSVSCQPDTLLLTASGTVSNSANDLVASSSDNCGVASISASKTTFTTADVGDNSVVVTVTDSSGNSTTCTANVYVIEPAPVALCQNATIYLNASGNATLAVGDIDNGSNSLIGLSSLTLSKTAFSCADVGTQTVTLIATNTFGSSDSCTATVTVVDSIAPVALTQNITVQLNAAGTVSIAAADVNDGSNDACGIAGMTVSPSSFTCAQVGSNTVTLTVTDNNGNVSTQNATVTVQDNVQPVASTKNITVQLDSTGNASIVAGDVNDGSNDACGIASMTVAPSAFTCAQVGSNTVTLTVTDNNGNVSTQNATVTVQDNVVPVAIAKNITVQLDATGNASITAADVNDGSSDACGIASMTVAPSAFTCAQVGSNTVTLTVTDNNGNVSTQSATVTVQDNVAPVALTKNITVQLDATGNASITAADVNDGSSDACGIASMTVAPSAFTCAQVGSNTVTLTVTDNNGNVSTQSATVTVQDNVAPVALTKNITVQLDSTGNTSIVAADVNDGSNDACGIASMTVAPSAFTCAQVGSNTVTLTVTDNNGNVSTQSATVTVQDNVAPVALTKNITVQLDATGNASITAADVNDGSNDACGIASMTVAPSAFTCAQVGSNTVTLTVTDNNGNVSTQSATVTVQDNVAPIALTKNITVQLDSTGNTSIVAADVNNGSNDACGIASMTVAPSSFTCAQVGSNTVTLTVTDNNGNVSTQSATVTVQDNVAPIALAKNITIQLDSTGNASIAAADVNDGSNDACGIASMAVAPNAFTCSEVGSNTVTLTVTDNNGNVSSTSSTVTVQDLIAPVVITKNITVQLDSTGQVSINVNNVDDGSNDACGIDTLTVSPATFTCSEVGANTVTLTATDANGNVSSATATVTVQDNVAPVVVTQNLNVTLNATGTISITASQVDNGSSDACGIDTMVVSPSSFTCADRGSNTVTLTVTDNNGNVSTETAQVTVEGNAEFETTTVVTQVDCKDNATGAIDLSISGGTLPYTYSWSNGDTTEDISNLLAGTYQVTVLDANSCDITLGDTVTEPPLLTASIASLSYSSLNTNAFGNQTHIVLGYGGQDSIQFFGSATGGTPGYSYSWFPTTDLDDPTSPNPVFKPSLPEDSCHVYHYTLTVTDSNGCTATYSVDVNVANVAKTKVYYVWKYVKNKGKKGKKGKRGKWGKKGKWVKVEYKVEKVIMCKTITYTKKHKCHYKCHGHRHHRNCKHKGGTYTYTKDIKIEVSKWAVKSLLRCGYKLGNCSSTCGSSKGGTRSDFIADEVEEDILPDEVTGPVVSVFPNPNDGAFTIDLNQLNEDDQIMIQVLDPSGRLVYEQNLENTGQEVTERIDLNEQTYMTTGMYILRIQVGDHQQYERIQVVK
ncbi:T9SS type A sorting domain-containing protein [bacterium SCSIO 12741]|nr:T9SS type A sorting domain-containing protein [bacterium SCSIO 12741]